MEFSQFTPGVHATGSIRERYQRTNTESTANPVKDLIGRLLVWFGLTFFAFVAFVFACLSAFTLGYSSGPPPEADRAPVIAMPVLFALSLVPLLDPGAPKGLRVFGVIWATLAGLVVLSVTVELW